MALRDAKEPLLMGALLCALWYVALIMVRTANGEQAGLDYIMTTLNIIDLPFRILYP